LLTESDRDDWRDRYPKHPEEPAEWLTPDEDDEWDERWDDHGSAPDDDWEDRNPPPDVWEEEDFD
jgi:hypothetical protein